ncbi:hypothetical protein L9F63_018120, partial [Diploptera punctata]
ILETNKRRSKATRIIKRRRTLEEIYRRYEHQHRRPEKKQHIRRSTNLKDAANTAMFSNDRLPCKKRS